MRRTFVAFLALALLWWAGTAPGSATALSGGAKAPAQVAEVKVEAPSAILIEASSGQVLFSQKADEARPIASLTKIMTLTLALEALLHSPGSAEA